MNKSPAIFQEIEKKLTKDHYASTLPVYHPAKGRRKRILKEPETEYQRNSNPISGSMIEGKTIGFKSFNNIQAQEPFPDSPPEIEKPGEREIEEPGEREIDPGRDFPEPDLPYPEEEEISGEEPNPEVDFPDRRDETP